MSRRFDLHRVIEQNKILLKFVGVWPPGDRYFSNKNYVCFSLSIIVFFVLSDIFFIAMNVTVTFGDLDKLSVVLTILSIKTLALNKLTFFLRNTKIVKLLMEQLDSNEFQSKNERQDILMRKSMADYTTAFRFFFFMGTLAAIMFVLAPILIQQRRMPFEEWYPHDHTVSPWFEVTFFYQTICTLFISLINIGVDTFSAGLLAIIGCQCELLEDRFHNFHRNIEEKNMANKSNLATNENQDCSDKLFQNLVEHHQQILIFSKRVNNLFSFYVFGQMSICLVLFCTALYRLSVVEVGSMDFFSIFTFISTIGVELFLYCWFGNEVDYKSSKLHLAAFQCEWVGLPTRFQKKLIFFMRKTKDPIRIYALSFFPLHTASFITIMRTSWSFFLLLRQLNE